MQVLVSSVSKQSTLTRRPAGHVGRVLPPPLSSTTNRRVKRAGRIHAVPGNDEAEYVQEQEHVTAASNPVYHTASAPITSPPPLAERVGNGALFGGAAFLGATLLLSVANFYKKYNLSENVARRKMLKNQDVVKTLAGLFPQERSKVTSSMVKTLRGKTGFTHTEIFRKFLWYILRDRKFDQDAVDDLLHLKEVMELSGDDIAEALRERSIRIEGKYGNLMLQLDGLSERGVQRKATCRALFSKMLYLVEEENLVPPGNETFNLEELRNIFGATEEDISKLRIISLQEVDIDVLNEMFDKKMDDQEPQA